MIFSIAVCLCLPDQTYWVLQGSQPGLVPAALERVAFNAICRTVGPASCIFCKSRLFVVRFVFTKLPSLNLPGSIQTSFLEQIKQRISANLSLADELAEALNLSRDSAYRRIRGETVLSLDEVKTLCNRYGISLDALLSPTSEMISFRHQAVDHSSFTFEHWLKSMLEKLEMIAAFPEKEKEIVYYAKDMPVFYYFTMPELSAFKMFFWMKRALNYPEYKKEKFRPEIIPKEYIAIEKRIGAKHSEF